MKYPFEVPVSRKGTNCLKYDFAEKRGYPPDVLPLWIADMDFPTAPTILEAMKKCVDHGIFGYSDALPDYTAAVIHWFTRHFHWSPDPAWLVKTPGVVFAIAMAVQSFTNEGDAVLVQPPVYYPFFSVIRTNRRALIENPLSYQNGRYTIDYEDFEQKIRDNHVKMFILCSPHNPVGRVWTAEELKRLGEICLKYGVLVVSDEIHCDITYSDRHPHTIFLNAAPDLQEQCIICNSPSKSFNLAGLQISNIWIPNDTLRRRFCGNIERCGYSGSNPFGLVATKAAYETGEDWLEACKDYLWGNFDFLRIFLRERLPMLKLIEPEGTYFAWIDCAGLGLSQEVLDRFVVERANLWLDAGHVFGKEGALFQRIAMACPRVTLEKALMQLERAVSELGKE